MNRDVRIVMADDHPIVRRGLRASIEEDATLHVIAEAGDGQAALDHIVALAPDVAVLDISMPRLDGFGVAKAIAARNLATRIIFLTLHNEEEIFHAAIDAGVKGYILKDSATEEICTAVHAVAAGRMYVSSAMTAFLVRPQQSASLQASGELAQPDADGAADYGPDRRRAFEQRDRRCAVDPLPYGREPSDEYVSQAGTGGRQCAAPVCARHQVEAGQSIEERRGRFRKV